MPLEEKARRLGDQAHPIPSLSVAGYDWRSVALHGLTVLRPLLPSDPGDRRNEHLLLSLESIALSEVPFLLFIFLDDTQLGYGINIKMMSCTRPGSVAISL
jgi:hypothetical protein